jgi:ABC-type nitrate/sulfonate/bicarbonate transport system substrate-binding protein
MIIPCWAKVEAKSVTFAYNTPTLSGTLPIVVAQDFGFFASEGLEVETVFIRGGPTAVAALVGGDVDYTFVAGVGAVRAIVQNAPLRIVSGIQPYMDYTLIGGRGIASLGDLKGKVVGVTGPGGVAEFASVKAWPKKAWCATAITRSFTESATTLRARVPWSPAKFRLRRFPIWSA